MYLHFMCVCVIKLFKCFTLLREPGGSPEVGVSELKVINLYTISSQVKHWHKMYYSIQGTYHCGEIESNE